MSKYISFIFRKWLCYPSFKRVLTHETNSEAEAILDETRIFQSSNFIDLSETLKRKWELLKKNLSVIYEFPIPRNVKAIKSMAWVRGAQSGFETAKAFCLLRERESCPGTK